jgi:hypothetical protein
VGGGDSGGEGGACLELEDLMGVLGGAWDVRVYNLAPYQPYIYRVLDERVRRETNAKDHIPKKEVSPSPPPNNLPLPHSRNTLPTPQ